MLDKRGEVYDNIIHNICMFLRLPGIILHTVTLMQK